MNTSMHTLYHIRVKGHLNNSWSEWFDGLTISNEPNGEAVLTASFVDQAALHAVLARVHSLNLLLISVMQGEAEINEGLNKSGEEAERR